MSTDLKQVLPSLPVASVLAAYLRVPNDHQREFLWSSTRFPGGGTGTSYECDWIITLPLQYTSARYEKFWEEYDALVDHERIMLGSKVWLTDGTWLEFMSREEGWEHYSIPAIPEACTPTINKGLI